MAKYECRLSGEFDALLDFFYDGIINGSLSASYEEGSDFAQGDFRCAVRVYERYSMIGGNRLSLTLTLAGRDGDVFLSAITTGGSQAMFFKVNTWGEEAFLECVSELAESYQRRRGGDRV